MVSFEKRLYAALPMIYRKSLEADNTLEIQFLCFNGNEFPITINGHDGCVSIEQINKDDVKIENLDKAELIAFEQPPLSEFVVVLKQSLNDTEKGILFFPGPYRTYLDFTNVSISCSDQDGHHGRIPLPAKILVSIFNVNFMSVGRVSTMRQRAPS